MPMNGSSPTGNCCNVSMDDTMTTCSKPNSSVLFDGHVPTLTGLDGDMWASQLLTIQTKKSPINVIFDFSDTPGYDRIERVEVVMFNCPQWGIASTTITLTGATARGQTFNTFASTSVSSLTSCGSLVRVCLSAFIPRQLIGLQFALDQDYEWVYLAEVNFYARDTTCPANVILDQQTTPPPDTTPPPPACTTPPLTTTPPEEQSSADTTLSQVTILTSVGTSTQDKITTTIIAAVVPLSIVLIIVIIVVVLILCIVCTTKHKHQLRAKEDHTTTHRQTHNHQPPQDRGHINLCEETGQAYYSSLHDIQGEDVPADQVYNRLERDTGPVRGGAKSSRGGTADQNEAEVGAYSTVSYSKQPQASKEAGVEGMEDPLSQLYAQIDEDVKKSKKKSEDVFATDQQEEASAFILHAQVDEKRKKKKKKKKEDTPSYEPDQLYAQVGKKKSKKEKEDSPPPELDQLYAQVDKKKKKKEKKEKTEEVSLQESRDVYSVVNKPSAPQVPLKSDLLMKELQ